VNEFRLTAGLFKDAIPSVGNVVCCTMIVDDQHGETGEDCNSPFCHFPRHNENISKISVVVTMSEFCNSTENHTTIVWFCNAVGFMLVLSAQSA
jgi:hypothetical protein